MSRPDNRPKGAHLVGTYSELDQFVRAFVDGKLNLLIIIGRPGLQKSRVVLTAVGPHACWIDGNATAFGIYCVLYRHLDQCVVIDDVDSLYADRAGVRLLKSLCQTELRKRVAWHSGATALRRERIPRKFITESRVLIISNEWKTLNAHVAAVEDRAHVILFEPTPLEVHTRTRSWFWDQQIFDFVARHLHLISQPSMRDYWKAWELKRADLDWHTYLLQRWGLSDRMLLVARLKADPRYSSENERVQAFIAKTGCCRATYFNLAKKMRPRILPPPLILSNPPPNDLQHDPDILDLLRRRHGRLGSG